MMDTVSLWAVCALLAYAVAALAYTVVERKRRGRISAIAKCIFALAMPGLGLVILVLYEVIADRCGFLERKGPADEDDESDSIFGESAYSADIVPLHDVFLMEDPRMKRKFFTDAIKQDVVESQSILREAVQDSDREISYYAVSTMTAHMEKLGEEVYALEEAIRRGGSDDELLEEYIEKVREYLLRRYGDAVSRERQRKRYMETLRTLAGRHPGHLAYRAEEIRELIRGGALEEAEAACAALRASAPEAELPLLLTLRLCQAQYDAARVRETVEALKQLPTRLSSEAMRAIRYWEGGAARE